MTPVAAIYAYCVLSGLLFAACAFAQLNDPDPLWWVLGYLCGGPFLNALVATACSHRSGYNAVARLRDPLRLNHAVMLFAMVTAAAAIRLALSLLPLLDFGLDWRSLAWSVLEHEEGREIAGLAILLAHTLRLGAYVRESLPTWRVVAGENIEGGRGEGVDALNSAGGTTGNDGSSAAKSTTRTSGACRGLAGTTVAASIFALAIYLWVYYQPEMNARYQTEHCNGQFGDRGEL